MSKFLWNCLVCGARVSSSEFHVCPEDENAEKKVAPKPEPKDTSTHAPRFFRGAKIR